MSPMLIEATPRRFRPKLWMASLLPVLAAIAILAWAGIDPFHRDPAAVAIEGQEAWAVLGVDSDRSLTIDLQGKPIWMDVPSGTANGLVKLTRVVPGRSGGHSNRDRSVYHFRRAAILQNGTGRNEASYNLAVQVSQIEVDPLSLSRARKLVAALPPAERWVGPESAILVGSLQGFHWEVRTYDRGHLPAEVTELIALTGLK